MTKNENYTYFRKQHPEIAESYDRFGELIHRKGGPLPEETRLLIKIAVSAASQYSYALQTHIEKARRAGCSEEDIEHAILLTAPTSGFPKMMSALKIFKELDQD